MSSAKDIRVAPIAAKDANALVKRVHYSHTFTRNSQLHLGVFLDGRLEGAMQFGPSMDKRRTQGLVRDTPWNGFLELNRMAFGAALPRNSESRALGVALRMIRKSYPHIQWIVSFADGTQCGDGTIYRAAGFWLTQIKRNTTLWRAPSGEVKADLSLRGAGAFGGFNKAQEVISKMTKTKGAHASLAGGAASMRAFREAGYAPLPGFQLRYLYALWPDVKERLTVPILPFSAIDEAGARMYLGQKREKQAMAGDQLAQRRCSADPRAPTEEPAK